MPTYRIQTSLQDVSGLPRDRYVTSLHAATTAAATDAQLNTMAQAGKEMMDGMGEFLSSAIGASGHTTKVYLIGAPTGTAPKKELDWSFSSPGVNLSNLKSLPNEVACCLTFHADPQASVPNAEHGDPYIPGVHRQSWRGRIYFGPLNAKAMGTGSGSGTGRPDPAFIAGVLSAGSAFANGLGLVSEALSPKWVILSRKQARIYPVARLSVDDAWDTQRSRGLRASAVTAGRTDIGGGPSGPIG